MARAALGLTVADLGSLAGVRASTISAFERGGDSYSSTLGKLQEALEGRGVVFIGKDQASLSGGYGVRLKG